MTRGRLAVHAHFYQPARLDPFTGQQPHEPAAAPFPDWNTRIDAECYRPNVERGNVARISYDIGPTLATWLARHDPGTYEGFIAADMGPDDEPIAGNAMAQAYHHSILPLASLLDRRTEIRWGVRDFQLRFGRPPLGIWLPETAVDLPTLRVCAASGIRYTILAPWQAAEPHLDTRHPFRVSLGDGQSIVVVFYDSTLSGAVSFDPTATADADRFARERVLARLAGAADPDGDAPLAVIATDGELYGHHQQFRDLFLEHLVNPGPTEPDRGFDLVDLAGVLDEPLDRPFRLARIEERTSWSCHHGVARWSAECPDAVDGRWKAPLRAAFERLAAAIDTVCEAWAARRTRPIDFWAARDAYVDVIFGAEPAPAFSAWWLGDDAGHDERDRFLDLLEAQRWRLAMFASDGWFWDDPIRPETRQCLRSAARAVRLVDRVAGTALEDRLLGDLELFTSPSRRLDGATIYRQALDEVGQPVP